ncbi:MAG: hypothetical protein ABTQ34_01570 [Bdellovibrionales bacterium]
MLTLRPLCLAAILALSAAAPAIAQNDDKNSGCAFQMPKGWEHQTAKWVGGCKNSQANGLGVLRRFEDNNAVETFYGTMENGALSLGVIDSGTGYIAGRFKEGALEHTEDRNVILDAFETASRAAKQLGDLYGRDGQKKQAIYYREQAKVLSEQMD